MKKKGLIAFIVIVIIVAIFILVYRCKIFKCKVEKPNEPVPADSPTKDWVVETFPLNVGMYGDNIRTLQKVLGIDQDGKLGTQTKNAILNKGYSLPLIQVNYDKIISSGSNNPDIGKLAKAKNPFTLVYWENGNTATYKDKNEDVGYITGISGDYYLIQGGYKVKKLVVYLV